jgi:TP901 family phage tail tape measure protein
MATGKGIQIKVGAEYDGKDLSRAMADLQKLQRQTQSQQQRMAEFGKNMQKLGGDLSKYVSLPIIALGAVALTTAAEFEKSMNKVRAVTGATGRDFDAMQEQAKELGRTTQFSASQAADGMSFLAMAGFEANEIVSSMPAVLNLAAAGQVELAQAADIASNIMSGYGMTTEQLGHAVDVMAKTFTSANTDISQLGDAMKYVGPVAASAGVQFEEVAAAIGLLGNAGIQGSMAGTTLRGAISALVGPGNKAANVMRKLGLDVTTADGKLRPLNQIIEQLAKSGATTADFMAIFGQRAGPGMAALVSQGADALRNLTGELENSGGTAQEIADIQMEGLSGAMLRLKSAFEGAMIALADSGLLTTATSLVEGLASAFGVLADFVGGLPKPIGAAALAFFGLVAAAGPALLIAGSLVRAYSTLSASLLAVAGSAKVAKIALVSTGIGAALVVVGTALATFAMNTGEASRAARDFNDSLRDQHGQLVENYRQMVLNRFEEMGIAQAARDAGVNVMHLVEAYSKGADALGPFINLLKQKRDLESGVDTTSQLDALDATVKALEAEAEAMRDNARAAEELALAQGQAEYAQLQSAIASGRVAEYMRDQKAAVDPTTAAMLELDAANEEVIDSFSELEAILDRRAGVRNYKQALDNLTESIEKNGTEFGTSTKEARNNEAALDNVVKTMMNVAEAALSPTARIRLMERAMAEADAVMNGMGMSDAARAALLQPFAEAIAEARELETELGNVRAAMDRIPMEKTVYIRFLTNFDSLPARAKSEFKNAATGGFIRGPGGPKADKVGPFMLSNGEFVIQASAVKKFGVDFFSQLNSGISPLQGFDTPGPSRNETVAPSGSRTLVIENVNVTAAPGERAETSVPRSLRRMAWVSGLDG